MINAETFLSLEEKLPDAVLIVPDVFPPSIRDCELADGCFDMMIHLSDPCPGCGAFRMQVGDWVCMGYCSGCTDPTDYS